MKDDAPAPETESDTWAEQPVGLVASARALLMRNPTNLARAALACITAVWFGLPLLANLSGKGLGVRFLVGAVAAWPIQAFAMLVVSIGLATAIYPVRGSDAKRFTLLPFVCLTLCLYSFLWLDLERTTDDMGGTLALAGYAGVAVLTVLVSPLIFLSPHKTLWLTLPALVVLFFLTGPPFQRLEFARNERGGDQIVAALSAFHEREGNYPNSLEDLIPQDLEEIPRPGRWFWLGSKFHYEARGFRQPGKNPTAYKIFYIAHGDMSLGSMWRSQTTEWTWNPSFDNDPQFELPVPSSRFKHRE